MKKAGPILSALGLAGCVSQSQFLDNLQGSALETALNRGRLELNCPEATGLVRSREVVQPALHEGPVVGGIQQAEYTVRVTGCDRKATYFVVCPDEDDGCFAVQSPKP